MAVVGIVTLLFGMFLGSCFPTGTSSPTAGKGSSGGTYTLPPEGGSPATTAAGSTSASTPVTSATKGTSSTTAPAATPTSAPAAGPLVVLLGPVQSQGSWTSNPFTVTGGSWNIGWAFRCTPAPATGPSFQVFVVPAGATPGSTAAVSETGGSGQSVTAQSTTGSQELVVRAPAGCIWAVKVTGTH